MIVLAFDIAYQSGWCVTDPDKIPGLRWGSFGVSCEGEEGLGRGLSHFRRNLLRIMTDYPGVGCLAWEKPIQASKHAATYDEYVKGATGILRLTAFDRGIEVLPCDMKAIRAHFIGDGTRPDAKAQVWQRCKVLGYSCKNDDESDAIACWDYATGILKVRQYEQTSAGFGGAGSRGAAKGGGARGHRQQ